MDGSRQGRPSGAGAVLAPLAAWAIVVPYLGHALGLSVDVPARVEFVDHVLPGAVVLLGALVLLAGRGRLAGDGAIAELVVPGLTFLAGVWMVSTHVPLLAQAAAGEVSWGPALLHNSPGIPLALLGLWLLLAPGRGDSARAAA